MLEGVLEVRDVVVAKQDASCEETVLSCGEIDASSTGEPTPRDMKGSMEKGASSTFEFLRQALDVRPLVVAAYEMVYPQSHGGRGSVLGAERSGSDGGAIPRCIDEHAPEHEPEGSDGWEGVRHRRVRRVDRDRVGVMVEGRTSGDGVGSIIDSSSRPKGGAPPLISARSTPG